MALKTGAEYKEELQSMKPKVYVFGEEVDDITEHPFLRPAFEANARYYDFCLDPRHKERMTTISTLVPGAEIINNIRLYDSKEYLVERFRTIRWLSKHFPLRAGRWPDPINAMYCVTYDCDQKYGTHYHERFKEYLRYLHRNNHMASLDQMDVKGDRSKRPLEQSDPDMYVHVVKRTRDGIVVRGAKAHQTSTIHSHELIIMPSRTMREDEKDYSIGFAVPTNAKGIIQVCARQPSDLRRLDGMDIDSGMPQYGGTEALIIFDDVFVPSERVFLDGEWDFSQELMSIFANYHRVLYAIKANLGDLIIGAAAQIAEYNGVATASHIRSKLVEMVILNETMHACALAAACEGVQTPSGVWVYDSILSNVVKNIVTKNMYEICRLAEDIAGGLLTTQPSEKDLRSPKIGAYITKYLRGIDGVPTEHRMRMFRLLECFTYGQGSTYARFEAMHGAGSPEAQKIFIQRDYDFEGLKKLARVACGIEGESY